MPGFCNKMFRRSFLEKIGFQFPAIRAYEDFASYVPVGLQAESIAYYSEPAYCYQIRSGSTMQQKKMSKKLLEIFPAEKHLREQLQKLQVGEEYQEEIEFMYIKHILHGASLRFIPFKGQRENLLALRQIIKDQFPQWKENMYIGEESTKYQMMCSLLYHKCYFLVRLLTKRR